MTGRLRRTVSRRPVLSAVALAGAASLVAAPAAHADIWANVGPASSLSGLKGGWTLGHYDLDQQFSAISAGVFSGVDASGLLPMVAYFFAKEIWLFTAWIANLVIELFGFAFSLDLVNGSTATGGAGALAPVSRAISSIYSSVFGGPWLVLAFSVSGIWAMWKALVQRRYAETAGQLALSLAYIGIAFLFVLQPAQTIGTASHWTNEMSAAFLSIAKDGQPASQTEAKEAGADQLFGLLVAQPWAVLEFGGLDHCVKAGTGSESEAESVAVEPLAEAPARRLESGEQVSTGGKTCINNLKKYGPHFLRFEQGSKERAQEIEALIAGDSSKLPDADPGKEDGSYKLGTADRPAGAAMEKEGQYQRLLIAVVVFIAELGAFFLLGALAVGIVTAQVLLLLLLAFSPVALVAAAIPGQGHRFFRGWLSKLAGYLLRKAAYSLILAILLTVCAAISAATSELGWFLSFGLQCAFFWAVFLQRRTLTEGLIGVVTGPSAPGRDRVLDVLGLYYGARVIGGATRPARRAAKGAGRSALWLGGRFVGRGRPNPLGDRRTPLGSKRVSLDLRGRRGGGGDEPGNTGAGPSKPDGGGDGGGSKSKGGGDADGSKSTGGGGDRGRSGGQAAKREDRAGDGGARDATPPREPSRSSGSAERRGGHRAPGTAAPGQAKSGGSERPDPERPARVESDRSADDRQGRRSPKRGGGVDAPRQEDRRGGLADELRADDERAKRPRRADRDGEPRESSGAGRTDWRRDRGGDRGRSAAPDDRGKTEAPE
jgi:hypothetical protein